MKISHRKYAHSLLLSGILLALSTPLLADEASSTKSQVAALTAAQNVSPEAQAVLDRMTSYIRGLKSFKVSAKSTRDEVMGYGYKLQHNETSTLLVQVPNKLRSEVIGDIRDRTFVYDGKDLVIYSPNENVYTTVQAPDTIGKLTGGLLNAGIEMPTIDVLVQAYAGNVAQKVRGGVLAGETLIEGVVCDHLAFRQSDADWQIWVEQGARPLIRKLVVTTRYEVGDPQYSATLTWDLNPKITKDSFVFTAPKDAAKIPFVNPEAINEIEQKGQ